MHVRGHVGGSAHTVSRPDDVTQRLVTQIEAGITAGAYPPGTQLRGRQLARDLGASRNTVAKAIDTLRARGLVTSERGEIARVTTRYTIIAVADRAAARDEEQWRGLPPAVARAGGEYYCDVTRSEDVPVPPDVATRLGVPAGTPVAVRARVQGAVEGGRKTPVQLATSWYTAETAAAVPEVRSRPDVDPPPVRRRMLDAGREIHYEHTAEFRAAADVEREALGLDEGAWVVEVWRLCVDHRTKVPIEVTLMVIDARKARLRY